MEDVIDLRPYLQKIFQNAKWIIGTALILSLATFFILRAQPDRYEATALVIELSEDEVYQFDPRILPALENQPANVLPELALNSALLNRLLQEEALAESEIKTVGDLEKILQAEAGSDRSLVRLTVTNQDSVLAAELANRWAELFITQANTIYGTQDNSQVTFFQDQLGQAKAELDTVEANLVEFQQINRTEIISNTLAYYREEQALYLTNQQSLTRLLQDSEQLHSQLLAQSGSSPITLSDQLTALNLQLEAYNLSENQPMLVQIGPETALIGTTRSEQLAFLERLIELIQNKISSVETHIDTLEQETLALQQQLQESVIVNDSLIRDRMVAEETYLLLARKLQEEQIIAQDASVGLRLASPAVVPSNPVSKQTLFFTVLAGAVGFFLSTLVILTNTWWRQEEQA